MEYLYILDNARELLRIAPTLMSPVSYFENQDRIHALVVSSRQAHDVFLTRSALVRETLANLQRPLGPDEILDEYISRNFPDIRPRAMIENQPDLGYQDRENVAEHKDRFPVAREYLERLRTASSDKTEANAQTVDGKIIIHEPCCSHYDLYSSSEVIGQQCEPVIVDEEVKNQKVKNQEEKDSEEKDKKQKHKP